MNTRSADDPLPAATPWRVLRRVRWPLGAVIALAFALGQLLEVVVLGGVDRQRAVFDVIGWGVLGGLAVWSCLTWVSRREQRYQAGVEQALREQQALNAQLQRANAHLALLSDVNRHIADSATMDEILDGAIQFPLRLVPARAAALYLIDTAGVVETRTADISSDELARLHERFADHLPAPDERRPRLLPRPPATDDPTALLIVPLHDSMATIGWIELVLDRSPALADDETALLQTIASEIAEAIISVRRRSREERALYELERAIADERARIARDIHDGITQTLAFRRMRIDLWLDWLDTDRDQLRAELIDTKRVLREQIGELRRAIFALRPVQFDELGFVGGLHRYVVEFASQHNWQPQIDLGGAPSTLTPALEAIAFRVVQEALTSVAKHARATTITVAMDQIDAGLHMVVADDGVGFDPGAVEPSGGAHVGLRQMQERVRNARGQLTIVSQPGAGTEIRVWLPLPATHAAPDRSALAAIET